MQEILRECLGINKKLPETGPSEGGWILKKQRLEVMGFAGCLFKSFWGAAWSFGPEH